MQVQCNTELRIPPSCAEELLVLPSHIQLHLVWKSDAFQKSTFAASAKHTLRHDYQNLKHHIVVIVEHVGLWHKLNVPYYSCRAVNAFQAFIAG